jgi:hypothetical protein
VILLSISALAKSFRAGTDGCSARVTVLRSIDLALWPGEVVALEGAPSTGRTTLLRCAAGMLSPDAGAIHWFGGRTSPGHHVAYIAATQIESPSARAERSLTPGALYAQLECAMRRESRIFLVDDLAAAGAIERRLTLSALRHCANLGASVLFAADEELAASPLITRTVTLADGVLVQRRKRSAARMTSSSPASRARASARSTYGRSLRSPQ